MTSKVVNQSSKKNELTLSANLEQLIESSMSDNTASSYRLALRQFADWSNKGRAINDATCAEYVAFIYESGRAVATAKMFAASMNKLAGQSDQPTPIGALTKSAISGFARQARGRGRGQAVGIGWESSDFIATLAAKSDTLSGLRNAAIISVMSDGLLRVSELSNLTVNDFQMQADGSGRLTISHSKTDQEGLGATVYLGQPTAKLIQSWLAVSGISDGALFRSISKGQKVGESKLSRQSISALLKQAAASAGIDSIRGHSLRVGSAQSLATRGASLVAMQQAGRWSDPTMPSHYAKAQLAARGAVAKLRYGA